MGIISSLIGGAFSLIGQGKANKRNMSINAANNEFNAKQAQLARDWQEEQYNKYSSPSALVRQYEEAGLNPALVAGVGQGTTFSGSSASAASPIAMQNPYGNVGLEVANLIETVKNNKSLRNLQQEQSETEDAKQRNLDSDTAGKVINNENLSEHWRKQFAEIDARIDTLKSEKEKNTANAALAAADALLKQAQENTELFNALKGNEDYVFKKWENEFREKNGYSPDTSLFNAIPTFISSVFNESGISTFGYKELISKARKELSELIEK